MKLFVYGKDFGRFADKPIKVTIESNLIDKAIILAKSESDDEKEDFFESEEIQALDWSLQCLLDGIVNDSFIEGQINEIMNNYKAVSAFKLELEEYAFGVALSKKEAKLEFRKIGDKDADWN